MQQVRDTARNKISRNVAPLTSVADKTHGNASANLFWAFVILIPSLGSRKGCYVKRIAREATPDNAIHRLNVSDQFLPSE